MKMLWMRRKNSAPGPTNRIPHWTSLLLPLTLAIILTGRSAELTAINGRHARVAPEWLKQATIYQVWLRSFSSEGTLKAVTARLPYLADLGVTFVYLSPFMKGPHPFKVSDYYALNPEHGSEEDLKALISEAHRLKLKVKMDVVFYQSAFYN